MANNNDCDEFFFKIKNELGYHDSNFLLKIHEKIHVKKDRAFRFSSTKGKRFEEGEEVMIKIPAFAPLKEPKMAKVVKLSTMDRPRDKTCFRKWQLV